VTIVCEYCILMYH